jgi:hypothetical protein
MNKVSFGLLLALAAPAASHANDGIAGVSAGGIVFGKTDAVAMKKEVLNVSYDKISVDYDFLNESAADVEETISFPLPEYTAGYQQSDTYYGQPSGFSIVVDGKPVAYKTMLAAKLDGKDVTARLRGFGLTDEQIAYFPSSSPFEKKVKPLSAQQQKALTGAGLYAQLAGDDAWVPAWTVQIHYVWQEKFPSRKVVHVHHEYAPFADAGPGASYIPDDFAKTHCADKDFFKAYNRVKATKEQHYVSAKWVSYILKTGNTWKNGIEDFTLNLVKKDPSELISLCFPGKFKKINPTTLQVKLKNFKPTRDLAVYFGNGDDSASSEGVEPKLSR